MQFKLFALSTLFATAISAPAELTNGTDVKWGLALQRNCTDVNVCIYTFGIKVNNADPIKCTITDIANPATTHSWYGKNCDENNAWEFSWGWDYPQNFVVATAVYSTNKTRSFYGYQDVNYGLPVITYDDQNPVIPEYY
ncbi:hypothetical protein BJ878DRAFT_69712 [Calycina marina]|uniref:Uncharacterized protein n=1 Tax=Calycina marina TaxID=1763456 RepID=A0A9P8CIR3_9HELO|nr:hypothetical protein BJ878DRAFT_69712 [Calycina marina]